MTDRELLELAAKAAELQVVWYGPDDDSEPWCFIPDCHPPHNRRQGDKWSGTVWNPLTDNGDALMLAVKCGISVLQFPACIGTRWPQNGLPARLIGFDPPYEDISSGKDVFAATRRAITRAAAELGKNL